MPSTWCTKAAELFLLGFAGSTAHAGSAHPVHPQQARRYRGQALPCGLSSTRGNARRPVRPRHRGTTAMAEQGDKLIKYLIVFVVHVEDHWLVLSLPSAGCHLAVALLRREQWGLSVEPELNLCINCFLHIIYLPH